MITYTHTNHIPLILFSAYTQYNTPCNVHQYILTLPLLAMVHIVKNRHKWQRILYLMHMHDKALLVLDQQSNQILLIIDQRLYIGTLGTYGGPISVI